MLKLHQGKLAVAEPRKETEEHEAMAAAVAGWRATFKGAPPADRVRLAMLITGGLQKLADSRALELARLANY